MKNILDSIIQVEQKLQRDQMDAQKEADELMQDAREKLAHLDAEYEAGFQADREKLLEAVREETGRYDQELKQKLQIELERTAQRAAAKSEKIIRKIREDFIRHSKDE